MNLNKIIGNKIFNSYLPATYYLANLLINFKLNKKFNSDVSKYHNDGLMKVKKLNDEEINKILFFINKQEDLAKKELRYFYYLDEDLKSLMKYIISDYYAEEILNLKNYYNSNLFITSVQIHRNNVFHDEKNCEPFANYYHFDVYLKNQFKLFINLHEVDNERGPLVVMDKINTKNFISKNKYYIRKFIDNDNLEKDFISYTHAEKGAAVFCGTGECLHRAGVPKRKSRDMITITFVASNSKKLNNNLYAFDKESPSLWEQNEITEQLAKPVGMKNMIKYLKNII